MVLGEHPWGRIKRRAHRPGHHRGTIDAILPQRPVEPVSTEAATAPWMLISSIIYQSNII
jgi:hypothetical protein